jgi:hypothetical protein
MNSLGRARFPLFCLIAVALTAGCNRTPESGGKSGPQTQQDDPLETARAALRDQADLPIVRGSLQHVGLYLTTHADRKPNPLPAEQQAALRDLFGLHDDELAEVTSPSFTLLDGQYLAYCFLLRDAIRALEVEPLPPVERATAAFRWVVRQVALQERPDDPPLASEFILRRGFGTAHERALIFLDLLQQIGMDGCLVVLPDGIQGSTRLWACAALIDEGETTHLYLFDPRLGLPLPGPDGKGVATLAAVRKGEPDLLAPLTVKRDAASAPAYDVDIEQARAAKLQLTPPLSALAPRLRFLADHLLGSSVHLRPAVDFGRLHARVLAAAKQLPGPPAAVQGDVAGVRALHSFMPPDEGGVDKTQLKNRAEASLVPMKLLPPGLQRSLPGKPGEWITGYFASAFVGFWLYPQQPRDQLLHGRYADAVGELIRIRDELRDNEATLRQATHLEKDLTDWIPRFLEAYANMVRAERAASLPGGRGGAEDLERAKANVDNLWRDGQPWLATLVDGVSARARNANVTYLLGQCKHEEAVREEARSGAGSASALEAWRDAATWWEAYLSEFSSGPLAAAVRLRLAEAKLALGEAAAARALLENRSDLSNLEKTACAYLVEQINKKAR